MIIIFHVEEEMKIISWEQDFLYTTEYCQQLREQNLLVLGYHIYFWEVTGAISLFWMCIHQVGRKVMMKNSF
jgi:hypothetical protein